MDIKDYFVRPKLINTVAYTQTTPTSIATLEVSAATAESTLFNFSRINGTFGWRATFCFRLQAIATPFHGGIVRMAFSPLEGPGNNAVSKVSYRPTMCQLPGVDLDLAESTSVVLKVPYIFPDNYFIYGASKVNKPQVMGTLGIYAYTPASLAAGNLPANLAIWMWLEDFELIGATPAELAFTSPSLLPAFDIESEPTLIPLPAVPEYLTDPDAEYVQVPNIVFESQMAPIGASDKEGKAIPGNLSNVLAAASRLVKWAGPRIPMISSFSGTASWALRESAKLAASYGWSKPLSIQPVTKMYNSVNTYQNNSDGPDTSYNLGLFSDNAVQPLPGFSGTDVDEMSLAYLLSVAGIASTGTLSPTDTLGAYAKVISLCPLHMYSNPASVSAIFPATGATVQFGRSIFPTPIYALANVFQKWRGGFKFRIKIGKTKFHTGRLALGFIPANYQNSQVVWRPTAPTIMQYKSVVWDLREGNTMEFECPFTSQVSYLDVRESFGSFFIVVLEPINGPPSVSSNVDYIVEVMAMDGFEFAQPTQPVCPLAPSNTLFYTQSGLDSVIHSNPDTESQYAIGEKVNSIKQLLGRACPAFVAAANGYYAYNVERYLPTWVPDPSLPTGMTGNINTYINYFLAFYAHTRGGYHMHGIPYGDFCALAINDTPDVSTNPGLASYVQESRSGIHVKMPFYNRRTRQGITGSTGQFPINNWFKVFTSKAAGGDPSIFFSVRAAEDYQLGYFIGAPPLAYPVATDISTATVLFKNRAGSAH